MDKDSSKNWDKDFREFLEAPACNPPHRLSERLVGQVVADLNPTPLLVFGKLLLLTVVAGAMSLIACPQFGFGNEVGLMRYFMELGPHFCSFACGTVFLSLGVILAAFVLRPEEVRVMRRTKYLQMTVVAGTSLSLFICAGASVVLTVAMLWLLGATLGGLFFLELSCRFRFAPVA